MNEEKVYLDEDGLARVLGKLHDNKFEGAVTTFSSDGKTITTTFANGYVHTTVFNDDGSITETIKKSASSSAYATRTTTFNADGSISENVSYT